MIHSRHASPSIYHGAGASSRILSASTTEEAMIWRGQLSFSDNDNDVQPKATGQ
jgi:hypothetical protein